MKGFSIYVKNDLLEPKHISQMDAAVWLYLWLLDKMTSINENGVGKVLGNTPVTSEMIQNELGLPDRTYRRWVARLRKYGYINTLRTPHGLIFTINKASKTFKSSAKSGLPYKPKSPAKYDLSKPEVIGQNVHSDRPKVAKRSAKLAHVNKDNTKTIQDNTIYTSTDVDMFDLKTFFYELVTKLGFTNQVRYTDKRRTKLKARLRTFKAEEILKASELIGGDAFLQGDNPGGVRYGDIDYLLRSDEQIDKQLNKANAKLNYKADW